MMRALAKKGATKFRGALSTVMTAGFWPKARLSQAGVKVDSILCPRCEVEPETYLHRCWTCIANNDIPRCADTQHVKDQAVQAVQSHPCYWPRGLITREWTAIPEPPDALQ
eukprot:5441466-Pyramimonas_sp.AAC.1